MTDDEFRALIFAIDQQYMDAIELALCRKQNGNQTYVRVRELIYYTPEAREAARVRDEATENVERQFYKELGEYDAAQHDLDGGL